MNSEEQVLREKMGSRNPFTVPEGYFDQLANDVIQQLPERRQKSRIVALRPWLYAAASVVVAVVMAISFLFNQKDTQEQTADNAADNTYIEEVADYAMFDNAEIYAYLSDN